MQAADVILTILEVEKLVTNAFFDENTASVLLYNGLFVLFHKVSLSFIKPIKSLHTLKIDSSIFSISPGFTVP